MRSVFWQYVLPPLVLGMFASFLIEHRTQPRPLPFWKRHWSALALHAGAWLLIFTVGLMVFRRPWLAAAIVPALTLALVVINNAKFESLREPFIFQDFEYFVDAIKHPRLYLPFLGTYRAVIGIGGVVLALYVAMWAEAPLRQIIPADHGWVNFFALFGLGITLLVLGCKRASQPKFQAESDFRASGLFACLWCYAIAEKKSLDVVPKYPITSACDVEASALPNLVVVQSESFFDVRRYCREVRPDVLQQFDGMKTTAVCYGQLHVPAWGANTVRSEFAFLSGVPPDKLGIHQFNPYRKLAQREFPTLASFLKRKGYWTVCVHPYPASFYRRDQVYPMLGFDEFIDISSFGSLKQGEPYVGDMMVAEKVTALLRSNVGKPLFVFVITMENHGPLHLERVHAGESDRLFSSAPPRGCEDLVVYTRHLINADRMVGKLCAQLEADSIPAWLCWYGDHVPIMPKVFRALGLPDGKTDYAIWRAGGNPAVPVAMDAKIEDLGQMLISSMGIGKFESPRPLSEAIRES